MQALEWEISEKEEKPCDMSSRGWQCVAHAGDIRRTQSHTALKASLCKKGLGTVFEEHQEVKSVIRSYRKSGSC